MEDGRLTDSKGRTVSFKNTILIMTSNVGSELLRKANIGFYVREKTAEEGKLEFEKRIKSILKDSFRPEFLNRIDEIVIFSNLTKIDIRKIVRLMLQKVQERLDEHEIQMEVSEDVIDYFVEHGFDEEYGARPLRRLIQRELENLLSEKIITGELPENSIVDVSVKNNELSIKVKAAANVKST